MTDKMTADEPDKPSDKILEELADDWVHEVTNESNRLRMVIDLEKNGEHDCEVRLAYTCNGLTMGIGLLAIVTNVIEQMEKKKGLTSEDTAPWKELQNSIRGKLESSIPMTVKSKPFRLLEPKKETMGRFDNIISTIPSEKPSE